MNAVQRFPSPLPLQTAEAAARHQAIKKIAWETFFELAATFSVAAIASVFAATPIAAAFIAGGAIVQVIVNLALRLTGMALGRHDERVSSEISWATSLNFAWGTGIYKQTLIHEAGHALAATAVYQNARARISLHPYYGGNTRFFTNPLSQLGRRLGHDKAIVFVTAAGPGLTLLVSAVELSVGLLSLKKNPQLSRCLIAMACLDFLLHALYALTTLITPKTLLSHDFVRLSLYGLNPVVAAVGILAIPLLLASGFYLYRAHPV